GSDREPHAGVTSVREREPARPAPALAFMAQPSEVVGVVGDDQVDRLDVGPSAVLYFPHAQDGDPALALVVRTSSDPGALAGRVRDEVRALEPAAPVHGVRTVE